ncbi:MAG: hypothetical protein J5I99_03350 [Verrucomicrobia bacterium]|nr:hypothetical protein [Kiritimatiellia bacterium]MCO6400248.1 hypothetical protein [Verrucomicrobiota bacterium]
MNPLGILILIAGPLLGIAWLVLEFKGTRPQRMTCGILALVTMTAVASLATLIINQLNYNAWYGFATKELIDETIRGIEAGHSDTVIQALKAFQAEYHPTYENRAKFKPLAETTTQRIKNGNPQPSGGAQCGYVHWFLPE